MSKMDLPINYEDASSYIRRQARLQYIEEQDGKCYHCGNPLSEPPTKDILSHELDLSLFPPNFLKWPIHLHHDHDDGMTIGAVHAYCNGFLWQYYGE